MRKGINVLSLFGGMECARLSVDGAGVRVCNYHSSEINDWSIAVAKDNYADINHLGDITSWRQWDIDWSSIDLILAGSPCQGFSFAGKRLNFDDPRSALFFILVDIYNHVKSCNRNVDIMLENVFMDAQSEAVISSMLNIEPVKLQSNIVAPVDRKRNYWCSWEIAPLEEVKIQWGDVREWGADDCFYYSEKAFNWLSKHAKRKNKDLKLYTVKGNMQMLEASMHKKYSSQRFFGVLDHKGVRYPTPLECERCHGVPDNYTACVSNSQRYQMLGNGWEVRTTTHILKCYRTQRGLL